MGYSGTRQVLVAEAISFRAMTGYGVDLQCIIRFGK